MTFSSKAPEPRQISLVAQETGFSKVPMLFLLMLLVLLAVAGYLFLHRLDRIEKRVVDLSERVQIMDEKTKESVQRSEEAYDRAIRAEENALRAEEGRAVAEAARMEAEDAVERAHEKTQKAQKEAALARQEAEQIRREREEELNRLQRTLNQIVETRRTALGLVMNLGSDFIQFDFDKATLRPENKELLSRIAGVLLSSTGYRVQIYGHTDDIGSEEYNLELSERRAKAVRDYLIEAGIDPEIIATKGFGKSNPLVPSTSPQARAKNRRVEIGIVDTIVNYQGAVKQSP